MLYKLGTPTWAGLFETLIHWMAFYSVDCQDCLSKPPGQISPVLVSDLALLDGKKTCERELYGRELSCGIDI